MTQLDWKRRLFDGRQHDKSCLLCEHRCAVNRAAGEKGTCRADARARIFRHRIEFGEEPEIVPSHLFYLSGCDLRCAFCIAGANAFDPSRGQELTQEKFNTAVDWGIREGVRTLQWVGGEPTIHLPRILELLSDCPTLPAIVWKSDFHGTPESFELLEGLVDIYVADFKFGNNTCAERIASVKNYVEIITRNLLLASQQTKLIIRHLVLPGHMDCCYRPVIDWLQKHLPTASLSLRDGYLPKWRAGRFDELARRLTRRESEDARRLAAMSGLEVIL